MPKQIQQPYPFRPGSKLALEWDWASQGWLPAGVSIANFEVTLEAGLTLDGQPTCTGGVVQAVVSMGDAVLLGQQLVATCKISTDQTPSLIEARDIVIVATRR